MSISSILMSAAGSDQNLLAAGPRSEWIKHLCKGVMVSLISLLGFVSFTYALILSLLPQGEISVIEKIFDYTLCTLFGFCWGLIIFNIYRFIVSSSGYGDGTEKVTREELISAFPKIILATILSISVSIPIGVTLLRGQIVSEFSENQKEVISQLNSDVDQLYATRLDQLYFEQAHIDGQIKLLVARRKSQESPPKIQEANNKADASGDVMVAERQALETELTNLKTKRLTVHASIDSMRKEISASKQDNESKVRKADALFSEAAKVLEQQLPILVILMLFMFLVHAIPIAQQIFSVKGPYDYESEYQNDLLLAQRGIARDVTHIKLLNSPHGVDRFLMAEKISAEYRKYLEARRVSIRQRIQQQSENARRLMS